MSNKSRGKAMAKSPGRPRGTYTPEILSEVRKDYEGGASLGDIAKKWEIAPGTASAWVLRSGATLRTYDEAMAIANQRPQEYYEDLKKLKDEYEKKRLSIRELAKKYGVSYGKMRRDLVMAGAKLRKQGGSERSGNDYGRQLQSGGRRG